MRYVITTLVAIAALALPTVASGRAMSTEQTFSTEAQSTCVSLTDEVDSILFDCAVDDELGSGDGSVVGGGEGSSDDPYVTADPPVDVSPCISTWGDDGSTDSCIGYSTEQPGDSGWVDPEGVITGEIGNGSGGSEVAAAGMGAESAAGSDTGADNVVMAPSVPVITVVRPTAQ